MTALATSGNTPDPNCAQCSNPGLKGVHTCRLRNCTGCGNRKCYCCCTKPERQLNELQATITRLETIVSTQRIDIARLYRLIQGRTGTP